MNKAIIYQRSQLSQISNELRIPVTGIIEMAHLLSQTSLDLEQKEYLQNIVTAANRLLHLEPILHSMLSN